jgi:DNA polymerase elongation subunit (family B)
MVTMDEIKSFKNTEGKTDYKKLEEYANQISAEISKEFPPPMKLEFENISKKFFILTKKRYMAELTNGKYKKRGVMVSRRDNASACRFIYEFMLKGIFAEKTQQIMEIEVLDLLNDLYSHKFATKEYCITKSIKEIDQYKIKPPDKDPLKRAKQFANKFLDPAVHTDVDYLLRALPAHVQLAERMRRRGMIVEPGSRLEYIITVSGGSKGKIWQKIESADYYKEHSDMIRLDMNYYCKSLVNPGDQVLFTMYKKKDFFKEQYSFRLLKADCLKELLRLFNTRIELTD